MHTVSKNFARRAVSASPGRAHSGDPTCPKSKDTIAPTQSAKATSTGGNLRTVSLCQRMRVMFATVPRTMQCIEQVRNQASHPNGIVKVIDIWKMAGNAMLLMIPELEMRAADCAASAVT